MVRGALAVCVAVFSLVIPGVALASAPAVAPRCEAPSATTASNVTAAPIPDGGTLERTFTVANAGPFIWDVDVTMNVTHPDPADLTSR